MKKHKGLMKFKLFRFLKSFFFPKDFMGEVKRGMEIGAGRRQAGLLGKGMFNLGKALRKKVDPRHKMKIGQQRKKK